MAKQFISESMDLLGGDLGGRCFRVDYGHQVIDSDLMPPYLDLFSPVR